jgi:hypothetical protein
MVFATRQDWRVWSRSSQPEIAPVVDRRFSRRDIQLALRPRRARSKDVIAVDGLCRNTYYVLSTPGGPTARNRPGPETANLFPLRVRVSQVSSLPYRHPVEESYSCPDDG